MRTEIRQMVPYGLGAPLLSFLWAQGPVQAYALRKLRARYPRHPLYADGQELDRELLQRHLNAHTFRKWREWALDRCSERSFARWTQFRGVEHLDAARAQGRGLILAGSHHGAAQTLKIVLARFGLDVVTLASGEDRRQLVHGRVIWVGEMGNESDLLRSMVAMRRVLKQRGAVHVPADSRRVGKSGIVIDFLGRRRRFAHGFAVLALTTGAPVVPVFALLDSRGCVTVEFHRALEVPQGGTRSERLESLVRQYAACLERTSQESPELVPPRFLHWLAKSPPAANPTPASAAP